MEITSIAGVISNGELNLYVGCENEKGILELKYDSNNLRGISRRVILKEAENVSSIAIAPVKFLYKAYDQLGNQ